MISDYKIKQNKVRRNYHISNVITSVVIIFQFILMGITASYDMVGYLTPILGIVTICGLLFMFMFIGFVWGYFYGEAVNYNVD